MFISTYILSGNGEDCKRKNKKVQNSADKSQQRLEFPKLKQL